MTQIIHISINMSVHKNINSLLVIRHGVVRTRRRTRIIRRRLQIIKHLEVDVTNNIRRSHRRQFLLRKLMGTLIGTLTLVGEGHEFTKAGPVFLLLALFAVLLGGPTLA